MQNLKLTIEITSLFVIDVRDEHNISLCHYDMYKYTKSALNFMNVNIIENTGLISMLLKYY